MADNDRNDDLKARMREALERKKQGHDDVIGGVDHQRGKGPAERGRQGGGGMFRRKAGGGG
jgi:hypothetical protein